MKTDKNRGVVTFNTAELDKTTLAICRAWVGDACRRFEIGTIGTKTKAQRKYQQHYLNGLKFAVDMLETLQGFAQENPPRDLECWNK